MSGRRVASLWCWALLCLMAGPTAAHASPAADLMAREINKARASHGLGPLRVSGNLDHSASGYAGWLMRHKVLTHARGIRASRSFPAVGEVLAYHSGWQMEVRRTVVQWLHSPVHRSAILNRIFTCVGAGSRRGRLAGRRSTIWVVQLGRR